MWENYVHVSISGELIVTKGLFSYPIGQPDNIIEESTSRVI